MRICYDIETDGLEATKVWCLVAHNMDTGATYKYSDYDDKLPGMEDACSLLANATVLVGHNLINFDNLVMEKLYGLDLNKKKVVDTWVMSQVLRYKRPHKHGLKAWGEALGNSKIDYDDWSGYSREMLRYCVQDVMLNVDVYKKLMEEFNAAYKFNKLISKGLEVEMETSKFNAYVKSRGWHFDRGQANENLKRMYSRMEKIQRTIEPKLGTHTVYIDKEPRLPKYKKNGDFVSHTAKQLSEHLGRVIRAEDTHLWTAGMPFQRTREDQITLGQIDLVKDYLLGIGWKPDDYTVKRIDGRWVNQSPKFTSTSLSKLGEIGNDLMDYYTLRNRTAVIEGWLSQVVEGRLNGNMWTIGTPTFRARHEVIVNLPGISSAYGKELRELLSADKDTVIVGADSAGNQLRGLCHYVGNEQFTHEVIFGDQHQRNADILGCDRNVAKSYLYAYLFGAGDAKLGQVLTGKFNKEVGKASRENFSKGIKGLSELKDRVQGAWRQTMSRQGQGWFPGLDGRPVFCESEHQCLNYLLQSAEGITCKAALAYAMQTIAAEGLRAEPRLWYHDEMAFQSHPEDAARVGEILKEAYAEAPKWFGVNCMDGGDYVIGNSYADVH